LVADLSASSPPVEDPLSQDSLADVESGLPDDARARLTGVPEVDGRRFFTSDLSVNEFLLVREAGFRPLGLVLGSSIYRVGLRSRMRGGSGEMRKLTQALYSARERAMTRMEAEADLLGADGVVGVRLDVRLRDFGKNLLEFVAIGTAIAAEDGGDWRTPAGKPFTSDLSGQDFWALLQTGYAPRGLVLGNCVYYVGRFAGARVGATTELTGFTQGMYAAREAAMNRMEAEATDLHAEGIVGVDIEESNHVWGSHVIEFLAVGTAVRPLSDGGEVGAVGSVEGPQLVLPVQA
jgi:uncharacterized protein YbjQ (UPF0145 family)